MGPCIERFDNVDPRAPDQSIRDSTSKLLEVIADLDAVMATEPGGGFLLGAWLKSSRAVANWDGSGGELSDFYEWNSRVQISTWAGAYSRRQWSGMLSGYYDERVKIWLNYTLSTGDGSGLTSSRFGLADQRPRHGTSTDADEGYVLAHGWDCNFDDIGKASCTDLDPIDCANGMFPATKSAE